MTADLAVRPAPPIQVVVPAPARAPMPEAVQHYGWTGVPLLRVERVDGRPVVRDLTVSVRIRGACAAVDPDPLFPLAERGIGEIEDFALRLANQLVPAYPDAAEVRVLVEEHPWQDLDGTGMDGAGMDGAGMDGAGMDGAGSAFRRLDTERRTTQVTSVGWRSWVVSGSAGLRLLKTGPADGFLAAAVSVRWRYLRTDLDWASSHRTAWRHLLAAFAEAGSGLATPQPTPQPTPQATLYAMGQQILAHCPEIGEVRLSVPTLYRVRAAGTGVEPEVYVLDDQPYGLVDATVLGNGPGAPSAW